MTRTPNLVLIGFMGTGKSSIGRKCAAMLGFPFHDTDAWVVRKAHKSIPEIFADDGEAAFRARESEAINALAQRSAVVLATGGGAVMNPENARVLRQSGVVVLLTSSVEAILSRVSGRGNRPLLQCDDPAGRVKDLMAQREPIYRSVANAVLDTTDLQREIAANEVVSLYRTLSA